MKFDNNKWINSHAHCFHRFYGIIHMVVPDGHVLEKCCGCDATRTVHIEHHFEYLYKPVSMSV
jgi:hypothetical protein